MAESRLQRWARKKAEASKESELAPHSTSAPPSTAESGPSPVEQELAINEALPEHGVLEKYGLPDPDTIELGTDITGFMQKEIPELLRRKALRALWKSNPVLAVLDGLNDYDEDFSNAATTVNGVQTLYRVGKGMFDKNARVDKQRDQELDKQTDKQAENQIQDQAEASEAIAPAGVTERETERATESVTAKSVEKAEPEIAAESLAAVESSTRTRHSEPLATETETAPRYRPRMRFDS